MKVEAEMREPQGKNHDKVRSPHGLEAGGLTLRQCASSGSGNLSSSARV